MSTLLQAIAYCLRCRWLDEGDPARVDKAAEKHTATGHPTATRTEPVKPQGGAS